MKKGTTAEARMHMKAPPEKVYEFVSDISRMGEWSPETVRCRWLAGITAPSVDARFKGTNRRGPFRWSTKSRVVAAEAGREFAFVTCMVVSGREMTMWRYRFALGADGGTDVTESFEMVNDLPWFIGFGERSLMRIEDRRADLEEGMERTLSRIKAAVEGHG